MNGLNLKIWSAKYKCLFIWIIPILFYIFVVDSGIVMKKYALLVILLCVTLFFGVLVYQTAYEQTVMVKAAGAAESAVETLANEEAFSKATKEMAKESGKSAMHFLFSLIYK